MNATELQRALTEHARAHASEWRRALDEHRRAHGLARVPTFLTPVLVDERAWEPLARACEALHRALARVQLAYFDGGRFRGALALPDATDELVLPSAREGTAVSCRFDVALDPARPLAMQVLEVQVGDASGAGWADLLWQGLAPLAAPLVERHGRELVCPSLLASHRRMALGALAAVRGRALEEEPRVAFACARDSFVRSDHEAMAALYRAHGTPALALDPRELEVRGRELYDADGRRVDLLVRDTVDEYRLEPFRSATDGLRRHLAAGGTLVLPPFRDALLDDKRALALLSSGAARDLPADDDEARAALDAHLPWTRVLDDELAARAVHERERYVVKPADGYGGQRVVVGAAVDDATWRAALLDARERPSRLQERAPLPRLPLLALDDEGEHASARWLCVSLWCHGGRFSGGYARASEDVVVSVHRGGGIVPLAFVR